MDNSSAAMFLESLLDRIELEPQTDKRKLSGYLSSHEISALERALELLKAQSQVEPTGSLPDSSKPTDEDLNNSQRGPDKGKMDLSEKHNVDIDISSIEIDKPVDEDIILCLDFGTAMSKAFATKIKDGEVVSTLSLKLGSRVSKSGLIYPVPSSIWIANDGLISFGESALVLSLQDHSGGRQRFDSPKKELIQGLVEATPDKSPLSKEINPTSVPFSKGDAITLYLGFLTYLACAELQEKYGLSRYVRRRFALPSWEESRRKWGEQMLATMLAKAQILADTFQGYWEKGIPIGEAKAVRDEINTYKKLPNFLIDQGVTEPLAVATSRLRRDEDTRGLVMVVDVGAGTSDFAMFVVSEIPNRNIFSAWPIHGCNKSLHQAGDTLDIALQLSILEKARIDTSNADYNYVIANLRMQLRALKESLFREKQCTFTLSNGDRGIIKLDEFLNHPAVLRFSMLLADTFQELLNSTNKSFFERFEGSGITVVLTGGGATLPMVTELANGVCNINGYRLKKQQALLVPDEFSQDKELRY
ncbi:MAG: hypothetical protein KKE00_00800, partial [Proteobacteria bacterium]|nr:hypothetical protein [Pseudomonadota bacterium]